MGQPQEPHGPGDREEEGPGTPWLPPDDRLWRHPSEVRGSPAVRPDPATRPVTRWLRNVQARLWLVGTISGFMGALASAAILLATGTVGTTSVYDNNPPRTTAAPLTDPPAKLVPPNLIGLLGTVSPSIVGITVTGPSGVLNGSGVLVDTVGDESYAVTDSALFTVSSSTTQVQVTTNWGGTASGHLVATDPFSGIALVKSVLLPVARASSDAANVGSVANVQTGEAVLAVGSLPMAASVNESAFSSGYISDTMSYLAPSNGASSALFSMLVANISVVSPDYGGAVVDSGGNVIGITNQVAGTPDWETYVVPIDTVMAEVSGMMKDGQAGSYAWLGIMQATDLSSPSGIQVESVGSGSPVAKAGIVDGDLVTALDGRSVSTVGSLIEWLANAKPGQVMSVSWLHNGHHHSADLTLGTQPTSANPS
jgi:putative serine protease PepD